MRQVGGALPRPATEIEEEAAPVAPVESVAAAATPGESSTAASVDVAVEAVDELTAPAAAAEPAEVAASAEAVGEAGSGSSADETSMNTDDAVEDSPGGAAPATEEAETAEVAEEDVSLEAILEDLKRREGRSE
jgi:hypothetical protein